MFRRDLLLIPKWTGIMQCNAMQCNAMQCNAVSLDVSENDDDDVRGWIYSMLESSPSDTCRKNIRVPVLMLQEKGGRAVQ